MILLLIKILWLAHLLMLCLRLAYNTSIYFLDCKKTLGFENILPSTDQLSKSSLLLHVLLITSLLWGFITDNFHMNYIFSHSSESLQWYFKIAALWSGQEGSTLLFFFFCQLFSFFAWKFQFQAQNDPLSFCFEQKSTELYSQKILSKNPQMKSFNFLEEFHLFKIFILINLLLMNAYQYFGDLFALNYPFAPQLGQDLNPLLKDYAMTYHPPLLLAGQAGFFALHLLNIFHIFYALSYFSHLQINDKFTNSQKENNNSYDHCAKSFSLWNNYLKNNKLFFTYLTLGILTIGILCGSKWAYHVLGWGGYWFWDPVETLSLIPWLIGFAWLHLSSKKDHYFLPVFSLIVLGLLIVRSDSLISVHAFSAQASSQPILIALIILHLIPWFYSYCRADQKKNSFGEFKNLTLRPPRKTLGFYSLGTIATILILALLLPVFLSFFTAKSHHIEPEFYQKVLPPIFLSFYVYFFTTQLRCSWAFKLALTLTYALSYYYFDLSYYHCLSLIILIILSFSSRIYSWTSQKTLHVLTLIMLTIIASHALLADKKEIYLDLRQGYTDSNISLSLSEFKSIKTEFKTSENIYLLNFQYNDIFGQRQQTLVAPYQQIHHVSELWTSQMALTGDLFIEYGFLIGEVIDENHIFITIFKQPFINMIWIVALAFSLCIFYEASKLFQGTRLFSYNNGYLQYQETIKIL